MDVYKNKIIDDLLLEMDFELVMKVLKEWVEKLLK